VVRSNSCPAIGEDSPSSLSHFQREPFILMIPRVETLGFYEADFVKTRRENCFLFIFVSFLDDL
jgi:hypothetical protein